MSAPNPPPRFSVACLLSFVLGLLSVLGGALTGVPALLLGVRGLRAVNRADGRTRGGGTPSLWSPPVRDRWLALVGMALGGAGTLFTVAGVLALIFLHFHTVSQRTGCSNNLRQIGEAAGKYHDLHDHFPAAGVPVAGLARERRLSWLAALLPFLDENPKASTRWADLAARIDYERAWDSEANAPAAGTPVPVFRCPADRRDDMLRSARSSYVGFTGVGESSIALPRTDPAAGMFGYERGVSRDALVRGLSATMMATETTKDNGPWAEAGRPTACGVPDGDVALIGWGRPFGGLHPAGLNVLWADGSVRLVHPDIRPDALQRQVLLGEELP